MDVCKSLVRVDDHAECARIGRLRNSTHPAIRLTFAIPLLAFVTVSVFAQTPDGSLKIYAVHVTKTVPFEKQFTGDGVYLGQGIVITAAHVVGRWPLFTLPHVLIAGRDLPARVIKAGSFDTVDLALLAVDEDPLPLTVRLRRNPLCKQSPQVGMQAVDVAPEAITPTRIISPLQILTALQGRFNTLTDSPQASGSGLFDAERHCLMGIMSAKVEKYHYEVENGRFVWKANGFAGYFVSAAQITQFIPPDLHL